MVRDLTLDIKERDLLFQDKSNPNMPVFDAIWGNLFDEDGAIEVLICNIIIPQGYWRTIEYTDDEYICRFTSPYIPDTRNFRVRLVAIQDGRYSLFANIRGDFGIPVNSFAISKNMAAPISASMLPYIDIDGQFVIKLVRNPNSELLDRAYIYSSKVTDVGIDFSDDQASQLLSICAPGKSYRYPTTGVGIIKYLNAVIDHTDLHDVLETQFSGDNKTILSADFDSETCNLDVLCNPEKAVDDENLEKVENLNFGFFEAFTDDYVRRNIVLNELSDTDFISSLNRYENVLNILLFEDSSTTTSRITNQVVPGKFDCEGNIIEDNEHLIVSATLDSGTIVMFDDETEDSYSDAPVFIINDYDETRLYTALIEQPYWIAETCHKCFILNKRSTVKYLISKEQFNAGKGLFVVEQSSNNLKNMMALVQDSNTGRLLGIVSSSTNLSDVILDEITQHIYAIQLK